MTEDLAYDLRQKYAEIVGVHLEKVSLARMGKNYPAYFQALEDLFTVIKHKFKKKNKNKDEVIDPEKKKKKEEDQKNDLELFFELRLIAINKANEFPNVYFSRTDNPMEVAQLEKSLRDMEMFLFKVMDESKMFGSLGYNEGM